MKKQAEARTDAPAEQLTLTPADALVVEILDNSGDVIERTELDAWCKARGVAGLAVDVMRVDLYRDATLTRQVLPASNIPPGCSMRRYLGHWQVRCELHSETDIGGHADCFEADTLAGAIAAMVDYARGAGGFPAYDAIGVARGGVMVDRVHLVGQPS